VVLLHRKKYKIFIIMVKSIKHQVKEFYSANQFPGTYKLDHILKIPNNSYISKLFEYITPIADVLDAGCGTGLISNLIAYHNPNCNIVGIDFADSVLYAKEFAKKNNINNITYTQTDFLNFSSNKKYDIVIALGLLHHMPDYAAGAELLKTLVKPNGFLLLSSFYPTGTYVKKIFPVKFKNSVFSNDQFNNPYEISFTVSEIKKLFYGFNLVDAYPKINNLLALRMLMNYKNNGLILYILQKKEGKL
jgi:SAM-dependent methyltransferase